MERYLIGVDVGTTGTKSVLLRGDGQALAHAYCGYKSHALLPGRVEQDANDWWHAVVQTVREVTRDPEAKKGVVGIALSTQGGTLVATDNSFRAVYPALVWSDLRCVDEAAAFARCFGRELMYERTGWTLVGGLAAMQAAWLRANEPEAFAAARWLLTTHDYISARLTGRAAIDPSNAGIAQFLNIRTGRYDADILDFIGIRESVLPEIVPSGMPVGRLTPSAAAALGLDESVLLISGAHDQYAGLLGAGILEEGDALIGTGTAWVITALSTSPDFASGLSVSRSALADKWGLLASIATSGASVDWLISNVALCDAEPAGRSYERLFDEIKTRRAAADDLFFLPYSSGSSFPIADPRAKAAFLGLGLSSDRFDMARAVVEGVCFQAAWALETFLERQSIARLKMSGGATKSPLWRQLMANIANRPIGISDSPDLSCLGAAMLAGIGAGVFENAHAAFRLANAGERMVEPDGKAAAQYQDYYARYKDVARGVLALYEGS